MPIAVKDVSLTYAAGTLFETKALCDVSLDIENGEFIGIMGHTGSGKSTLISLLAGLAKPDSGTVMVDGSDINAKGYDFTELRSKVGVVFQYPESQLFESTVEKDVAFGLKHHGLSKSETEERVKWALSVTGFDFETIRRRPPLVLSGGEKRRVAIAGVLAARPRYLILDEPIAGLDPLGREDFLKLITRLNGEGMTIIMVTHNADSLGEYARRVLVFNEGRLVKNGPAGEVFEDVEEMRRLSVGVSQSRELAYLLGLRGVPIPQRITAYDELYASVRSLLKGGERL